MNAFLGIITACVGMACAGHAQSMSGFDDRAIIILPQRRVLPPVGRAARLPVTLEKVAAQVLVNGRNAQTSLTLTVKNGGKAPTEAELLLPVPEGAVVKGFYYGDGKTKWQASLMPAAEARRLYDSIVARRLDPALLEFAGFCAIRSSVFPVPADSSVTLGVVYEQLLSPENGRLDYVLPRSEALSGGAQWSIRVELAPQEKEKPCNVLVPSHGMEQKTLRDGTEVLTLKDPVMSPGPFRLSWREPSADKGENAASPEVSVYAAPDATDGKNGYFLIMLGKNASNPSPEKQDAVAAKLSIPRNVTLVLDRSGSMRGKKLEKMKEAAKQIISGLKNGELFNVIAYNEGVDSFAAYSVRRTPQTEKSAHEWLNSLSARGGTNIHEALKTALTPLRERELRAQLRDMAMRSSPSILDKEWGINPFITPLPVVLFLTDGQPTIGITSEKDIITLVENGNEKKKRIFTIGVGTDLNAPLLRKIAELSGGLPTYIQEGDQLEIKMARLFRQLSGPLLTNMRYEACDMRGEKAPNRVQSVLPARVLPDLFAGSPVVLTGRYTGTEPFIVKLTYTCKDGREGSSSIVVDPGRIATVKDDFAARLWAARKIGELETALIDMGADPARAGELRGNPKTKELVEEMMRLSHDFGIMSSAASFFADDGSSQLERGPGLRPVPVMPGMVTRDIDLFMNGERSGAAAVALQQNAMQKKQELSVNKFNTQKNARGHSVSFTDTAQIAQNSYFNKNGLWRENTVTAPTPRADRTVQVGTPEYAAVADSLIRTNRQGLLALEGSVLFRLNGELVLMQNNLP